MTSTKLAQKRKKELQNATSIVSQQNDGLVVIYVGTHNFRKAKGKVNIWHFTSEKAILINSQWQREKSLHGYSMSKLAVAYGITDVIDFRDESWHSLEEWSKESKNTRMVISSVFT